MDILYAGWKVGEGCTLFASCGEGVIGVGVKMVGFFVEISLGQWAVLGKNATFHSSSLPVPPSVPIAVSNSSTVIGNNNTERGKIELTGRENGWMKNCITLIKALRWANAIKCGK